MYCLTSVGESRTILDTWEGQSKQALLTKISIYDSHLSAQKNFGRVGSQFADIKTEDILAKL